MQTWWNKQQAMHQYDLIEIAYSIKGLALKEANTLL